APNKGRSVESAVGALDECGVRPRSVQEVGAFKAVERREAAPILVQAVNGAESESPSIERHAVKPPIRRFDNARPEIPPAIGPDHEIVQNSKTAAVLREPVNGPASG